MSEIKSPVLNQEGLSTLVHNIKLKFDKSGGTISGDVSVTGNLTTTGTISATTLTGSVSGSKVVYDNTTSKLSATNIQNAVDELKVSQDDTKNSAITFTSSDTTNDNATEWTSVDTLTSGETHSSIFAKISQMFKNIRYLYKTKANASDIKNGTLTIQKNGTTVQTFTANSDDDAVCNITVPTNTNELTNGAGYITSSDGCNYANSAGSATNDSSGNKITDTYYLASNPSGYITSDGSCNYATSSGSATNDSNGDKISDTYYKASNPNGYITSSDGCNYAASAGNADTVDGLHKASFGASLSVDGATVSLLNSDGTVLSSITTQDTNTTYDMSSQAVKSANQILYTDTGSGCVTANQTSSSYFNSEQNWASYIICNHGDGATYYHQMMRFPFWGVPQYQRMSDGNLSGWQTFITTENISSQSVNYATTAGSASANGGNADTVGGLGKTSFGTSLSVNGTTVSLVNSDGTVLSSINTQDTNTTYSNISQFANDSGYITSSGSCASADKPTGFSSRTTGASWGITTGTSFTSWDDSTGGSIDFRQDCPNSGQLSIKVDGLFYQNEGRYACIDTNTIGSQSVNYANTAGWAQPTFNNGTWYVVGDDVYIGDHNVGGGLGLLGANGNTRLDFCQYGNSGNYKSITFDGSTLYMNGNCDYASNTNYASGGWMDWNYNGEPIASIYVNSGDGHLNIRNNKDSNYIFLRSAAVGIITDAGAYTNIYAGAFNVTSSKRYKTNIEHITEERAKRLLDVNVVTYDYKDGIVQSESQYDRTGVIAEEVIDIMPEVVGYKEVENVNVIDSVDYTRFVPSLIKLVQMQQEKIDELEERIASLENN